MNKSYLTAMYRKTLSAPMKYLLSEGLIFGLHRLDYGCGRGTDADFFADEEGYFFHKYDPYYFPELDRTKKYDFITCNFVLNTLLPCERVRVIEDIKSLLSDDGVAYISVRNDKKNLNGYTKKGTYQDFVDLDLPVEKKTSSFVMYRLEKGE